MSVNTTHSAVRVTECVLPKFHPTQSSSHAFSDLKMVVVKTTNRCNLRCSYCHEHISSSETLDLPVEIFQNTIEAIVQHSNRRHIHVLFFGGEPSLLPLDEWYEKTIPFAKQLAAEHGKTIRFSMQTNLLDLQEEAIQFYKQNQVHLSTSLDGVPDVNARSRGGSQRVLNNLHLAVEAGILKSVLTVINQSNWQEMEQFINWLWNDIGIGHFKANVVYPVGAYYESTPISSDMIFSAQKSIIDYMMETKGQGVIEQNIAREIKHFFEGGPSAENVNQYICSKQNCGAGKQLITLTPNGAIMPCARLPWDDTSWYLDQLPQGKGNTEIDQHSYANKLALFEQTIEETWSDCEKCTARTICSFGCRAFAMRSKVAQNIECTPTKLRFRYYQQNEENLHHVYKALQNRHRFSMDQTTRRVYDFPCHTDYSDHDDHWDN